VLLDQQGIARFAQRHLMPDTVRITREADGEVLDPSTGVLVPIDRLVVHSGQAGLYGHQERIRSRGGAEGAWVQEVRPGYRMLLPLSAPELCEGDEVRVVQARDVQAVGRIYRVTALPEVSSFPVLRTVWLEEHNREAAA
jgi:hypothetical protein